jgi:hypothetical protein
MGFLRNAMRFFRGRAGKRREDGAAEFLKRDDGAGDLLKEDDGAAESLEGQASAVKAQPVVVSREVKREARPDPNKPGWSRTIGSEMGKGHGDRASQG